jgi:alpha-beta hydrolase superfamily lysophospholipase
MPSAILRFHVLRYTRRCLLAVAAIVLIWLLGSFAVGYYFTHRLTSSYAEPAPDISWGKIEQLRLTTSDGEELGAWFVAGAVDQPAVVLLHGYHGCRGNCLSRAEFLARAGCSVLLVTLRAHGDSSGQINDIGYSARQDVIAAVAWLEQRRPGGKIIVFGHSQGAAAAMFAATELGRRVHGYIWESPYRDLHTAVRNRTEMYLPVVASSLAYAGLCLTAPLVLPEADRIAPVRAIDGMPQPTPVLILAGGRDRRARPEEAAEIFQQIKQQATLEMFDEADHAQLMQKEPERYQRVVLRFVTKLH